MEPIDPAYPRPTFVRPEWASLSGTWDFSSDAGTDVDAVAWNATIQVPFPPESPASGVGHPEASYTTVWYRRRFSVAPHWAGKRILLHFGAVDYAASVWVNDRLVVTHEGGHTPFSADITHALGEGEQTIVVRAHDDPAAMDKPRGKQDWETPSHHIWYPRTTGIWQPVWLEPVEPVHVAKLHFTPDLPNFSVHVEAHVAGVEALREGDGVFLDLELFQAGKLLTSTSVPVARRETRCALQLSDPGIYHARNDFLWTPERPNLLDVRATLRWSRDGEVQTPDVVSSYTALRSVGTSGNAFVLNGRSYFLRMVLDQGYWRESHLAAPDDEALRRDVELVKALGFNGVRKHQKVEDPRFLYWADTLGLLVWEELPSAYAFSRTSTERLMREWTEIIDRDYNHPSIVTWVTFNESWGLPDIAVNDDRRHLVRALYHLTRTLDRTRLVVGNDGWEHVVTDMLTLHDYSREPEILEERYATHTSVRDTVAQHRMSGRAVFADVASNELRTVVLSEFGGIRLGRGQAGWGYTDAKDAADLLDRYAAFISAASSQALAGFCYTQFTDTFQEQNGLVYDDRTPKADLAALAAATKNESRKETRTDPITPQEPAQIA